jgi:hypothetical protein
VTSSHFASKDVVRSVNSGYVAVHMKTWIATFVVVAGFASLSFGDENVVIEGAIKDSDYCAPLKSVEGTISGTNDKITVCAGDLNTADYTNGASRSEALTDGKLYYIVGTLHEGTLSVSEVAKLSE